MIFIPNMKIPGLLRRLRRRKSDAFQFQSILSLECEPPGAENPPILPPAASARWHGMMRATGFFAIA